MTDTAPRGAAGPRTTYSLVGHEDAERRLLAAATSGKMAHAWLIGGPRGVGKATLAFRLARFLLSGQAEAGGGLFGMEPESLAVEPDLPAVRRIAAGGHADLLVIDRPFLNASKTETQDLNITEIRRIGPFLRLRPAEGGWRVVIVDEAHAMNRNAANALLKILEEPPVRAIVILVSEAPGAMLPTIRSRCRQIMLSPLGEDEVMRVLQDARPELEEGAARMLARLSDGAPGQALTLADLSAIERYGALLGVLETAPDLDWTKAQPLLDQATGPKPDGWPLTAALVQWWLSRLVAAMARGTRPAEVVAGESALIDRLLASAPALAHWLGVWDKARDLIARADRANLDKKQALIEILSVFDQPR